MIADSQTGMAYAALFSLRSTAIRPPIPIPTAEMDCHSSGFTAKPMAVTTEPRPTHVDGSLRRSAMKLNKPDISVLLRLMFSDVVCVDPRLHVGNQRGFDHVLA